MPYQPVKKHSVKAYATSVMSRVRTWRSSPRYADGRFEKLPGLAAELVRLNVDVIVASPTEAIRAAQGATKTIPIVMAFSGDPVGSGIVAQLAHPGGNITGLTTMAAELTAKRLEFLKAIAPT